MRAAILLFVLASPALAQDIPQVNVDRLCGSRDMCHNSTAPACVALPEESKAYRRPLFNACIDEQQQAYDNAKEGLPRLGEADRTECLNRVAGARDYRVLGNCVSDKLMQREREEDLDRPRTFQR